MVMESANAGAVKRRRANTSGQRRLASHDFRTDMETSNWAREVELDILSCRFCADHIANIGSTQAPLSRFAVICGQSQHGAGRGKKLRGATSLVPACCVLQVRAPVLGANLGVTALRSGMGMKRSKVSLTSGFRPPFQAGPTISAGYSRAQPSMRSITPGRLHCSRKCA
jgi:hypothetical protein